MQCLDQELARLTKKGIINEEHALENVMINKNFIGFLMQDSDTFNKELRIFV